MFAKIFVKEWRDNRFLLSLTGLILALLIVMGLAGRGKTAVDIAGVLLLCVLPISSLLLGSGAYSAELRNNAWSYLFSRPVRKSTIWITKYLALLSFLAAAFMILNLAVAFLPGLKGVLADFYAPDFFGNLALYGLAIFLALTISYSLSILSEKSLITFAVSVFTGALLFWLHAQFLQLLRERYAHWGNFAVMGLFIGASFILASVLTLARIDFTQQAKKLFSFVSLLLLFLALSFVAETFIISKGNPFSKPTIVAWRSSKFGGNAYLETMTGRVIRYDPKEVIARKMSSSFSYGYPEFSSAGSKIWYIRTDRSWTGTWHDEACVANLDGTQQTSLARFYGTDSAFNGWTPEGNVLISSSGRQAAFVAVPPRPGRERSIPVLFWMNVDGTGSGNRPLEFYRKGEILLLSWLEDERSIVLRLAEEDLHSLTIKFIKLNIETGTAQSLETSFPSPRNFDWMPAPALSPDRKSVIIRLWDEAQKKDKTVLLDLGSFETKAIGENVQFWRMAWAPQGDRVAYPRFREQSLMVYSIVDGSLKKAWQQTDKRVGFSYDWLADGRLIIAGGGKDNEGFLNILSEDFTPEKRIKIPDWILDKIEEHGFGIFGLNDKVLITSERNGIWRLDLKTEEWKKVY